MRKIFLALFFLFAFAGIAQAQPQQGVVVEAPWAMVTIGDMHNSAIYFTLTNKSDKPVIFLSARSPIAEHVQLHANVMDADVIRMRHIPSVDIAPGESLHLRPGAHHLMVMGLKQALKEGDIFPVILEFEGGLTLDVAVAVKSKEQPDSHYPQLQNPYERHDGDEGD